MMRDMTFKRAKLLPLATCIAATLAAMIAPALARATPPALTSLSAHARWSGVMHSGVVPDRALCTPATCWERELRVALRSRAFSRRPSGMLVALRWPDDQLDVGYDLDLYVYGPDGKLAASSTDIQYSTDEAAWIQNPRNGNYRIVVAARGQIGDSPFDVAAYFEPGRETFQKSTLLGVTPWDRQLVVLGRGKATPARTLLPDLVPLPAHNFHMETTAAASFYDATDRGLRHPPSCYPQETLGLDADSPDASTPHPLRCLRFDADLLNLGNGPYEIRAYPNNGNGTDAWQVLYNSDGTYAERKAGQAVFSSAHGHIHFRGFDDTGLYTMTPGGTPGRLVASMVDKGRCALDVHNARFDQQGAAPMHYIFPSTCDTNDEQDPADPVYPDAAYFRSGISPGWNDEYPWFIPDQYIDVTNVPNGRYLIVDRINSAHNVTESDGSNDTAVACVDVHPTTATACQ